jgi:hypothetical protein
MRNRSSLSDKFEQIALDKQGEILGVYDLCYVKGLNIFEIRSNRRATIRIALGAEIWKSKCYDDT